MREAGMKSNFKVSAAEYGKIKRMSIGQLSKWLEIYYRNAYEAGYAAGFNTGARKQAEAGEQQLSDSAAYTEEEMIQHFIDNMGMSREQAEQAVGGMLDGK